MITTSTSSTRSSVVMDRVTVSPSIARWLEGWSGSLEPLLELNVMPETSGAVVSTTTEYPLSSEVCVSGEESALPEGSLKEVISNSTDSTSSPEVTVCSTVQLLPSPSSEAL